jgi:uncharacterized protein YyaL (SSP411 family)
MNLIRVFLLWLALTGPALAALENRLVGHPSPYLALHGADPVAWQPWGEAALALARESGRPLFVSVGYFSCHWCHVMQRESYRDADIAALINRAFIPVKIDREIHTGLDAMFQAFAERTRGIAGWPLNVVVTPEGYPLAAILYAPPEEFRGFLARVEARWKTESAELSRLARAAVAPVPEVKPVRLAPAFAKQVEQAFARAVLSEADSLHGGFGQVSRFPNAPQLLAMLELLPRHPEFAAFLRLTLDAMARRGLADHIHGGFFRYTVDPDWATPHFEKMLYDNAQLARVFLLAAERLGRPDYAMVARRALDFMLDTLQAPQGGFMTSVSALDRDGREGGHTLWDREDLTRVLSREDYERVRRAWGLDRPATGEAGWLALLPEQAGADELRELARIHAHLRTLRAGTPPLDNKRLAGLNGLALVALTRAAAQDERYRVAARATRDFLRALWDGKRLVKGRAGEATLPDAELEDYAWAARGLWDFAALTRDAGDRRVALDLARAAWIKFHARGGFALAAGSLLPGMPREAAPPDGALISPAAALIGLSLESGDAGLVKLARGALAQAGVDVARDPFGRASYVGLLAP